MIIRKCFKVSTLCYQLTFNYHNYYDTLEVEHGATQQEIKRKYYELAKKYHPDSQLNTKNSQKFIDIKQAYSILGDQTKRKNYDNNFYSSQHYHYDNTNYNQKYESQKQKKYREQEERSYNEPFISILKRSYFSIFLWMCYAYMTFTVVNFGLDKMREHEKQQRQKLIDDTPGVIARRRAYYEKIMKEKNIYGLPVDLKYRTLEKQSTRSKQKRKNNLETIKGVKKLKYQQEQPVSKTEYM